GRGKGVGGRFDITGNGRSERSRTQGRTRDPPPPPPPRHSLREWEEGDAPRPPIRSVACGRPPGTLCASPALRESPELRGFRGASTTYAGTTLLHFSPGKSPGRAGPALGHRPVTEAPSESPGDYRYCQALPLILSPQFTHLHHI